MIFVFKMKLAVAKKSFFTLERDDLKGIGTCVDKKSKL